MVVHLSWSLNLITWIVQRLWDCTVQLHLYQWLINAKSLIRGKRNLRIIDYWSWLNLRHIYGHMPSEHTMGKPLRSTKIILIKMHLNNSWQVWFKLPLTILDIFQSRDIDISIIEKSLWNKEIYPISRNYLLIEM